MSNINSHQQQQQQPSPQAPSNNNPSPLLTISILCIVGASALFLLAYYAFVNTKCCSSSFLHFFSLITSSTEPADQEDDSSFIALSPTNWTRTIGLDDLIRDLPTRHYYHHTTATAAATETATVDYDCKCVVCLNEFHEHDVLRVLPNCAHSFHLDCIDVWLHSNSNCPICRTGINSSSSYSAFGVVAPMSSPQREAESVIGSDEDFVVIELGGGGDHRNSVVRSDSMRRKQSPLFLKQSTPTGKQGKQRRNASIMGDEGIDVGCGDRFMVEYPMRRSFSWGSAADRQLLSSVRAVVRQNSQSSRCCDQAESSSSSSSRGRRLFLPFGKIKGSRNNNAVTPLKSDVCFS